MCGEINLTLTRTRTLEILSKTDWIFKMIVHQYQIASTSSGFRGGGGGGGGGADAPFPRGFDPLPTQRVPPLGLFKKCISGRPFEQYILILRGERAPKKRDFLVKIFQKVTKNAFFGLFFQSFDCGAENLAETGSKPGLGRARKIISVDLKKRSTKFSKIFENPRPPLRENPRSAPGFNYDFISC